MKTTLIAHLKAMFESKNACLTFAEYMAEVLFHPQFGYYNAPQFKLGRNGAFVTAPEISPLFAQCFANQCLQLFAYLDDVCILELGAGSGRFAADLLLALENADALPSHYYIYDVSLHLRKKQKDLLQEKCPHLIARITWLDALPHEFSGVIIANEVLDALPVHCFRIEAKDIQEKQVSIIADDERVQLKWHIARALNEKLIAEVTELKQLYQLPSGYESEINLHLQDFIKTLAQMLQKGVILFADYGYGEHEYYHPQRSSGTLATIYQGKRLDDPLLYPGEQDITAHVDFTRVARYAIEYGLTLSGFTTQATFLLSAGLIDLAMRSENELKSIDETFKLHQAIKYLTLPTEMGERVKVMALSKNMDDEIDQPLLGFTMKDCRFEL